MCRARRPSRPRVALLFASILVLGATACSGSSRSQDAFCRQGPLLVSARRAVDSADAGDLKGSKHRMAAFNDAIQKAVEVAPDELANDIEPLGKLWADLNQNVQRARSTDEVAAATQDAIDQRRSTYERSSQAVNDYVDQHCTTAGGTK